MGTVKSYIKEVTARLKGDQSEVIVQKNYRKAISAINGQLAAQRARLVDDESAVEDAQEALNNAKYPTELISNNSNYIRDIQSAQNRLDNAEETAANTAATIQYFEALLTEFDSEVEA